MIKEGNRYLHSATPSPKQRRPAPLAACSMHLPLHASLPSGRHVTVDHMTEAQVSDMFRMITKAARHGDGYGVDEYPAEADFRRDIRTGSSYIVCCKDSSRLLGAFTLATSKFYRGNDAKVADPIIIVRRSERGRGVGEFIFRQVVHFSKRLGYSGIYVDTFSNNVAMIKIVERTPGFRKVGSLPLGGKLPDGSVIGTNVYFKDLKDLSSNVSGDNTR